MEIKLFEPLKRFIIFVINAGGECDGGLYDFIGTADNIEIVENIFNKD